MRKWQLLVLVVLLLPPGGPFASAQGPEPAEKVLYSRLSNFLIPITAGEGKDRLKQIQLFVSTDRGRTWQPADIVTPDKTSFRFVADHDGLYWFTVQTRDRLGRYYPPTLDNPRVDLRVFVDTQPPVVKLTPLPPRGKEIGVAWRITDDTVDLNIPDAFRLSYKLANAVEWQPLYARPSSGEIYWDPQTDGGVEVWLRVRDQAGNWGEGKISLDGSGWSGGGATEDPPPRPANRISPRPRGNVRMVNSKTFTLNYDVKEVGPSRVSTVDIWYTQDGQSWHKLRTQKCTDSADAKGPFAVEIKVDAEGLYGFTLVVHSGVGLSERPPQVGDEPQVWVEVDVTKPVIQLAKIVVGRGPDLGKLTITWRATDKNLTDRPITLSYAESSDGPWTTIAEKLENTGRYVWKMPDTKPYQFLVRAEAVDRAGNVGVAVTAEKIAVDLALPKVRIIGIEPAGKSQ
jgi:hypothetical protein